jgi:hypothetical protein
MLTLGGEAVTHMAIEPDLNDGGYRVIAYIGAVRWECIGIRRTQWGARRLARRALRMTSRAVEVVQREDA